MAKSLWLVGAAVAWIGCGGEVVTAPPDGAVVEDLPEEPTEDIPPSIDGGREDRGEAATDREAVDVDGARPLDVANDRATDGAPAPDVALDRATDDAGPDRADAAGADGAGADVGADRADAAGDSAGIDAAADRADAAGDRAGIDAAADRAADDVAVDRAGADAAADRTAPDSGAVDSGAGDAAIDAPAIDVPVADRPDVMEASCPYTTAAGEVVFDVRSAPLSGRFTVNGAAPSLPAGAASLYLARGGDFATLGDMSAGGYRTALIPGTYDILFRREMGDAALPRNTEAWIRTGVEVPPAGGTLDIDVRTATLSGRFTINGAAGPGRRLAGLGLTNRVGTAGIAGELGDYSAPVIPGTYDLYYVGPAATADGSPSNQYTTIRRGVVVPPGGTTLNVDVPAAAVSGRVTVNGAAPPAGSRATLSLSSADTHRAPLTDVSAGTYRTAVIPGTYDLYYESPDGTPGLPRNPRVRLRAGVVVPPGGTTLDVDIPMADLTGRWTVNGAPATGVTAGGLALFTMGSTTYVPITVPRSDVLRASMVPGTYEVRYAGAPFDPTGPANDGVRIRSVDLRPGGTTINVDVPSAMATVSLSVNGRFPPGFAGTSLALRQGADDRVTFQFSSSGPVTLPVIPGTYEVVYEGATGFSGYPRTVGVTLRTGVVIPPGGATLTFDVPAISFSWGLTLNGAPWPAAGSVAALCLLSGVYCSDLGNFGDGISPPVAMIPGVYDVYYRWMGGAGHPRNSNARLSCLWGR